MSQFHDTHQKYLLSPHWETLRKRAFGIAGNRCEGCGRKKELQGHHIRYREPLEMCTEADIMALCHLCHGSWHDYLQRNNLTLGQFNRESTIKTIRSMIGNGSVKKRPKSKKHKMVSILAREKAGLKPMPMGNKLDILERLVFDQAKRIFELERNVAELMGKRIVDAQPLTH